MANYLMIDFGSTFTKLTAVSSETEDIIATSSHFTTVATDITIGYNNALEKLYDNIGERINFDKVIEISALKKKALDAQFLLDSKKSLGE